MEIAPQASRQQLHGCTLGTGEVSATIMEIAPQASRQYLHGCTPTNKKGYALPRSLSQ
jgi:hypothetical protein